MNARRQHGGAAAVACVCLLALAAGARAETERRRSDAQERLRKRVEQLKPATAQLRGLPFRRGVVTRLVTRDELRERLRKEIEKEFSTERFLAMQDAGICLGFFPEGFDLKSTIMEMLSSQIAGFYDPERKDLCLIDPEAGAFEAAVARLAAAFLGVSDQDIAIVHELVHALQDQHLGLSRLPLKQEHNDDIATAIQSVFEGDATMSMLRYIRNNSVLGELDLEELVRASASVGVLGDAPPILQESLVFPYISGMSFVRHAYQRGGWEGVNALFRDPPLSTEQVLHPSRYFAEQRDHPTWVRCRPVRSLLRGGWKLRDRNVLGEFGVRILLEERGTRQSSRNAAAGWDGDRYQVYKRARDGRLLLLWVSVWDSPKDAADFASAYSEAWNRESKAWLNGPDGDWKGWTLPGGRAAWVVQDDTRVWVADGLDGTDAPVALLNEWKRGARFRILSHARRAD